MNKISGIYKITNTITCEFYIGSSKDIKHRWENHKSPTCLRQHPNVRLYQDITKYGKDAFTFEIIEETITLHEREQYWMDELKPTYNIRHANDAHYKTHRKEYWKENYDRLCQFEGETLKLSALMKRLKRKGIAHPTQEAKKYLI